MKNNRIAIILPTYNEAKHIKAVLQGIKKYNQNIIVVDDCSLDESYNLAVEEGVDVLRHAVNLGKGATLKTGVEYAKQKGFDSVIFMDADAQHNPNELKLFQIALRKYDFVLGTRRLGVNTRSIRYLGNKLDSWMIKLLFGKTATDPLCGFRGFSLRVFPFIRWDSSGYSVETEMVIRALKHNIKLLEIPIQSIYHDTYKGVTILDGLKILSDILRLRVTL